MTNIQMIALDMDNTLLLPNKTLSEKNTRVLKKLHQNGKKIVLTTGRPLPNVKNFITQLGLNQPNDHVILFNGGLIKNIHTDQNILDKHFIIADVTDIFNVIANLNLSIDIVSPDSVFSIKDFGQSHYVDLVGQLIPYFESTLSQLPPDLTFNKFVVCADESELDYLETVLQHTPLLTQNLSFVRSRRMLLEFVPHGVNKGTALSKLLAHFSLTSENLMAFGDEENDFAMLKLAKVSVAMDNAIPSIKQVATHSTKSNQQDGVAVFLEKYFD